MQRLLFAALSAAALATALPASAQFQKPEDAVKYRKAGMTLMAAHFGRLGAMAQDKVPFDAAAATANAQIAADMSKLPFAGFVENTSGTEKGSPKPNVWTERAKFDEGAKKLQDDMAKLVSAAKSLDTLKVAFNEAAKNCKSCHDQFRNK